MLEENELYERVWGESPPPAPYGEPDPPRRVLSLAFPPLEAPDPSGLERQIARLSSAISEIKSAIAAAPQQPAGPARRVPAGDAAPGIDMEQLRAELSDGLARVSDTLTGQMETLHREMTSRFDEQQELTLKFLKSMESAAVSLNKIASQPHRSRFGRE